MPPEREGGLITWQIGNAATVWLVSGLIALLGLAVSLGWFRVGSAVRPLGAAVVILMAIPVIQFTPLIENDPQASVVKRAIFVFPCVGPGGLVRSPRLLEGAPLQEGDVPSDEEREMGPLADHGPRGRADVHGAELPAIQSASSAPSIRSFTTGTWVL
jgi:hypothetical protein